MQGKLLTRQIKHFGAAIDSDCYMQKLPRGK